MSLDSTKSLPPINAVLNKAVPNEHAWPRHQSFADRICSYRLVCIAFVSALVSALLVSLFLFLIFSAYARYTPVPEVHTARIEERLHLASVAPPGEPGTQRSGLRFEYKEPSGFLSNWAVTKEPWTGGPISPTKARSTGSFGRGDPPATSQPSMKLLTNGELNFTRKGLVVVDSLVSVKVLPGMELEFDLMLLTPPEESVAPPAAHEQSPVGLSNPEIRLTFCSQEIGNWPPNQRGAVREKMRTCRLSATAHVGPNWRLRLNFAVEGGRLRVWNEQGATMMDIVFVADEL